MEDVLGGWTDPTRFDAFLADWEAILARRVDEAVATLSAVEGVRGLILGGGVGRGQAWPLSDIDFLIMYDDHDSVADRRDEIERRCVEMHARWMDEGWWTSVDAGKLAFGRDEVARVLATDRPPLAELLQDDRWYHSLDKGYQGQVVYDAGAFDGDLVRWLTDQRFNPDVVQFRLARERREVEAAYRQLCDSVTSEDVLAAAKALQAAGKWLQILFLEQWGERDASLARVGTRFENVARSHGRPDLVDIVNRINNLDEESIERRMADAPGWVWEWHDRSWRARTQIGETVTPLQHTRDVVRVCALFELRRIVGRPFPAWLAIPTEVSAYEERLSLLAAVLCDEIFA